MNQTMYRTYKCVRSFTIALLINAFLLTNIIPPNNTLAAVTSVTDSPLRLTEANGTLSITWAMDGTEASALATLPQIRYQGYELPLHLFTTYLQDKAPGNAPATPVITTLEKSQWLEPLSPAAPMAPPTDSWSGAHSAVSAETVALPDSPLFVVRAGQSQGQQMAVMAFSPLFESNGTIYLATSLEAQIHQTSLDVIQSTTNPAPGTVMAASAFSTDPNLLPTNPLASGNAQKIIVEKPGIQRISGSSLAAAGLNLASTDPAKLQLWHQGNQRPLQINGLVSGKLAPTSVLSFYAPSVGNRWNTTSIYWLAAGNTNGLRMATRSIAPANGTVRTSAWEKGEWVANRLYESSLPGADGDHWFHEQMVFSPSTPPTLSISPDASLPRAAGTASYTLTTSTRLGAAFQLDIQLGTNTQSLNWHSAPNQVHAPNRSHTFNTQLPIITVDLQFSQGDPIHGLYIDRLAWQQPAELNFGGQGARFSGLIGDWVYQWQQAPIDSTFGGYQLYDVTDPDTPILLTGATNVGFQDGPQAADYLITGPSTAHEPTVVAHTPVQFMNAQGADAIYITPAAFSTALAPLVNHRQQQGYQVQVIDVQTIYDAWSYGYTSADAIRAFLRFAHNHWQPQPIAATLIGDATWDPYNYENKTHHTNWMPAYVAYVDPWIGEAACDNCYGQLDGSDPVTGDALAGQFFATELWIGRLPREINPGIE